MPKCPECGRAMASVLKREGGVVNTYNECHICSPPSPPTSDEPAASEPEPPAGSAEDQ